MTPQQKMGSELLEFFKVATPGSRIWLDGIKMRIYVRMEVSQCIEYFSSEINSQNIGTRLNIASVEYFESEDWERFAQRWFIDFCEFAHDRNPWEFTFLESVDKTTARILYDRFGWRVEMQPGCLFKTKRKLPEGHFWNLTCTKNTEE